MIPMWLGTNCTDILFPFWSQLFTPSLNLINAALGTVRHGPSFFYNVEIVCVDMIL